MASIFNFERICITIIKIIYIYIFVFTLNSANAQANISSDILKSEVKQAYLLDYESGQVLYNKNGEQQMTPSSMTKILTTYIAFDRIEKKIIGLEDLFRISKKAALKGGAKNVLSVNRVGVSKAKQVDKKLENVNEGHYHNYRNDESLTPKQKIGYSMREVRDKLNELDKLVKMNVRLKNEIGVDSTSYWKRTHGAMKKISERLVKLANKVGQLY